MAKPKVLVAYYSRSGTTRRVAEAIAHAIHGDIDAIVDQTGRAGLLGYLRSLVEVLQRLPSPIEPAQRDPAAYDLVIIGTPVWASSVSSPVRSYLMTNKVALRQVAFFCTFGGRGSEGTFAQMQAIAGKAPLARCAVRAGQVWSDRSADAVADFVAQLAPPAPATKRTA